MAEVGSPVEGGVVGDELAALVGVAVDGGRDARQLGNQVERVLVHRVPVVELADALLIRCRELAFRLRPHEEAGLSGLPTNSMAEPGSTLDAGHSRMKALPLCHENHRS